MCPRATFSSADDCIIRTVHPSRRHSQQGSNLNGINELMRQQLSSQLQELVAEAEKGPVLSRRSIGSFPSVRSGQQGEATICERRRRTSNEETPRQRLLDIIDEVLDLVDEDC